MGIFELSFSLILAVLLSSLLSQVASRISLPLIQIAIGVCIALFVNMPVKPDLDPDLLMLVFIAPLLFKEASEIDRLGFWKNKGMILSLAIGLVLATVLAVGFTLNALEPSISLAAAFALGAALGPTDAVSVSSMAGVASLTKKQKSILSGESLINDASGIVAFQFAVAAAVTGTFSVFDATISFAEEFAGGIILGIIVGWLLNRFISFVRDRGLENRTFHVLFEVAIPFAVYMLGDLVGVSGILAVVCCGIVFSSSKKQNGPIIAKTNIVSSSFWDVISFALNGIVFVLLGMMLPSGVMTEIENGSVVNTGLLAESAIVTCIVIGARFLWTLIVERVFGDADEINTGLLKHSAILAFAGAKGTITLSIAMSLPFALQCRNDLVFIASFTIIATLILANIFVPILAPAETSNMDSNDRKLNEHVRILRRVIEHLTNDAEDAEGYEKIAYQTVIGEYSRRVTRLKDHAGIDDGDELTLLRIEALHWQEAYASDLLSRGESDANVVRSFITNTIKHAKRLEKNSAITWRMNAFKRKIRNGFNMLRKSFGNGNGKKKLEDYDELSLKCKAYALGRLSKYVSSDTEWSPETVSRLMVEYQKSITALRSTSPSVTQFIKGNDTSDDVRLSAYRYEQEFIGDAYSDGRIDRKTANELRRQVSAMQLDAANEI